MIFDGNNGGTVELLETVLVIRRKGIASTLAHGLKGEKRVPYSSITSVQFKEPGLTTGYIQFGVHGGRESRGGVWDATTDENTVLFTKPAADEFRRLRDLVEARIGSPLQGGASAASSVSISEELGRLADLRDRGVLSDEEFNEQKRRLLGSAAPPIAAVAVTSAPAAEPARPSLRAQTSAPDEPPAKKRLGKVLGFGCIGLLGLIVLLSVIGSNVSDQSLNATSNEMDRNLAAVDLTTPENIEAPVAEPSSNWSYSQDEDKVRGGTTYYASTTSTNSIDQNFPYDSNTTMNMTVRKSPAHGTDVVLQISSGQMMCPSYDGCSGTARFDSGPPQRISFNGPADNSSDTIFVEGAKSFISKLKRSKKVTVEKTLYEAGNPQFEFDVAGLKWEH